MEFIYRLKRFSKQKVFLFWTFVFPIVLGTLFNLAFSNLNNINVLKEIKVTIVKNEYYEKDPYLLKVLESITLDVADNKKMFVVTFIDSKENKNDYLSDLKEVDGIIEVQEKGYNLLVNSNEMTQEITKNILNQIIQTTKYITSIALINPLKIEEAIVLLNEEINSTHFEMLGKNPVDATLLYFYSLIAMTAIYAAFWGNKEIEDINIESSIGKRVFASTNNKIKTLSINLSCSYLVNIVGNSIVLLYFKYILGINFNYFLVVLICAIGGFCGLMLGTFISLFIKGTANTKQSITTAIVMIFSFCAGMMSNEIKYMLDSKVPFFNFINPVNLLTESLYQIYYYGFNTKVVGLLSGVLLIGIVLLICNFIKVRRIKL